MELKKETIKELGIILKEEFNLTLKPTELEKLAYCLIGYFGVLQKIANRHEVQK